MCIEIDWPSFGLNWSDSHIQYQNQWHSFPSGIEFMMSSHVAMASRRSCHSINCEFLMHSVEFPSIRMHPDDSFIISSRKKLANTYIGLKYPTIEQLTMCLLARQQIDKIDCEPIFHVPCGTLNKQQHLELHAGRPWAIAPVRAKAFRWMVNMSWFLFALSLLDGVKLDCHPAKCHRVLCIL